MKLTITDKQEIEFLHFIFERELKPPFISGRVNDFGSYPYYNSDNKLIGWLNSDECFGIITQFRNNIKDKVCLAFEYDCYSLDWWQPIKPHLKSWLGNQINVNIFNI